MVRHEQKFYLAALEKKKQETRQTLGLALTLSTHGQLLQLNVFTQATIVRGWIETGTSLWKAKQATNTTEQTQGYDV